MRWATFTGRTPKAKTKNPLPLRASPVMLVTMNECRQGSPITDLLRRMIVESGLSYNALQRETGVTRASMMRFVEGRQSLRLDIADRLAAFFGLALQKK